MQRRHFLQSLAWLTGGLFITRCTPAKALNISGKTVQGTVSANGKGLKDVIVSDGYSVVATDKKGRYSLVPHPDAIALFVSTPSGYAFPQERSIARHYRLMQNVDISKENNFELQPLDRDDNEHQFIIWA
ncbi:MAG: metallophosphoesterase, partial [Chitinophagaceae bacterium]